MSKNDKGPIIGIDLGTIFSCIGIMRNDRVDIVPEVIQEKILYSQLYGLLPQKL